MKEDFEAEVNDTSYDGWGGWAEETTVSPTTGDDFQDRIKPFVGKKVRVIIEEIK